MDFEDDIGVCQLEEKPIEEELYINPYYKTLNDVVIFLIDLQIEDGKVIKKIFSIIESFLKTKIITNENDLFGIFLYNSNKSSNSLGIEGVSILINISQSDAELIKKVKFLNLNYSHSQSKSQFSLNNALWVCQHEFKAFDPQNYNRRIFLFTENDYPIIDEHDREMTIQRGKDLAESDIIIELFPMNTSSKLPFNIKKFYADILIVTNDNISIADNKKQASSFNDYIHLTNEYSENRIKEITKRIRQKEIKKRSLGNCNFKVSNGVEFLINFFTTIRKATKPSCIVIDARTNKELSNISQPICKETGSILYNNQIGNCQEYGKTKIPFSRDDMNKIKSIEEPGLKLIGFKSYDKLKEYHNIKSSYFVYPDEDHNPGSSQFCNALIRQLIFKNRICICKFIPREGCNIRICALLPQKESFDDDYFQTPPGFNLVFLPYAEEIRSNGGILEHVRKNYSIDYSERSKEKEIELAKKIVKKMSIDFDSRAFENVSIQKFYSSLQALALGEDNCDNFKDVLVPDEEGFQNLKGCDQEFWNYFNEMKILRMDDKEDKVDSYNSPLRNKKLKEISFSSEKRTKEKTKSKGSLYINDEEMIVLQKNDGLRQLTVNCLKENLEERNIKAPYKCRKDELLLRLEDYLIKLDE